MKLRVKTSSITEEIINLKPLKVEAPNHNTLMAIIAAFVEQNPKEEILYNCQKFNRKKVDELVVPSKWVANVYTIDAELIKDMHVRQNARSFEISYNPLKPIVYKQKAKRQVKIAVEEAKVVVEEVKIVMSNTPVNANSSLV